MKTQQQLIKELNNYFYTIYKDYEVSPTETYNALLALLEYQFALNDLDPACYNITIHFCKQMDKRVSARMLPDSKYDDKYDIYLNPTYMKVERPLDLSKHKKDLSKPEVDCRLIPNKLINKNKRNSCINNILFFFTVASHEFQHIIQFETMPDLAAHSYQYLCTIDYSVKYFAHTKDKKCLKLLNRYYDIFQVMSIMEKDADLNSYKIIVGLLETLINNTTDKNYIEFLSNCQDIVAYFLQDRKIGWKNYAEEYKKVSRDLKKFYNLETPL